MRSFPQTVRLFFLAALGLALVPGVFNWRTLGEQSVSQIQFVKGLVTTDLAPPKQAIRPVKAAVTLAPAASGPAGYSAPYANGSRNSRAGGGPAASAYRIRWSATLSAADGLTWVLQQQDRILLQRGMQWQLWNMDGRSLTSGPMGAGPLFMNADRASFYRILPSAHFAAARLSDGQQSFLFLPDFGDTFERTFIDARGDRLLVAGEELMLDPHGRRQPSQSVLEALDVKAPVATTPLGQLTNGIPVGGLRIGSPKLQVAANDTYVAAAVNGQVLVADWNINVKVALTGDFEPALMSLDEGGEFTWSSNPRDGRLCG